MSKAKEMAYEAAKNSQLIIKDRGVIEVMDASVIWPDFTGKETEYNRKLGENRTVNLVLNETMVGQLNELESYTGAKFRIRTKEVYDDPNDERRDTLYYINVKVRMDGDYPAICKLFTKFPDGKVTNKLLNADTVCVLDSALNDATCIDLSFKQYINKNHPEQCTAYLKKIYVTQEAKLDFGGKYDDWDDSGDDNYNQSIIDPMTGERA